MKYCDNCGTAINEGEKFCSGCGQKVDNNVINNVSGNNKKSISPLGIFFIILGTIVISFVGFIVLILLIPDEWLETDETTTSQITSAEVQTSELTTTNITTTVSTTTQTTTTATTTSAKKASDYTTTDDSKFDYNITKKYRDKYGFSYYIEGYVKNNKDINYNYIQISFICYDKNGNNLGTAIDNSNNLLGNQTWKYKAMFFGSNSENVHHCDFYEIESF